MIPESHQKTDSFIGSYRIIRTLGQGGMGTVLLAFDERLDREVAIKFLGNSRLNKEALIQEAKLLAKLNHTNVVQVYDIFEHEGCLYLVMEYVKGKSLYELSQEPNIDYLQQLKWLSGIAKGMAAAHELGIVHNDLKASNVLIDETGQAKIIDFGIARAHDETLPLSEELSGSCYAVSPELAKGEITDHRSDLFAFGILAFTLVCGRHPFVESGTPMQVVQRIINGEAKKAKELTPELPEPLCDLLAQLLEKSPSKRPQNTGWVARRLQSFCEELTGEASVDSWQVNKLASLFFIVLLFAIGYGAYLWAGKELEIRYVAVQPPVMASHEGLSDEQQRLITLTVLDALNTSVIAQENLELIASEEVQDSNDEPLILAKSIGADEIITSKIHCTDNRCELQLSRLKGQRMGVAKRRQWPVLTDSLLTLSQQIQQEFTKLYPESVSDRVWQLPDEKSYEDYISLYNKIKLNGQILDDDLDQLKALLDRVPAFIPAYELYREASLERFDQTGEQAYLTKLEALLNQSSPMVKESHYFAINHYWLAISREDYKLAGNYIVKAEDMGADPALLNELQATLHLASNELELASASYESAIKLRASNKLYYNLALSYWWQGEVEKAKETLRSLLEKNPSYSDGQQFLASVYLMEGELDEAISAYEAIVSVSPKSINLNNLGLGYMLKKEYELAYQQFKQAAEQGKNNPTWLLNLADTSYLLGNKEEANGYYYKVLELHQEGHDVKSYLERSQAYVHLGLKEEAVRAMHQSQKLAPDNGEVYFNAALIYSSLGEHTSALTQVRYALDNEVGSVWFQLPWFDNLCQQAAFVDIMNKHNEPERCR